MITVYKCKSIQYPTIDLIYESEIGRLNVYKGMSDERAAHKVNITIKV
jgi:hypothetical protein